MQTNMELVKVKYESDLYAVCFHVNRQPSKNTLESIFHPVSVNQSPKCFLKPSAIKDSLLRFG